MARKTQLSQERILAAARGLVESEGLDGLSMRRLAQELDVWPMSVYRYFQDKDELLDALAAGAAEDFEPPSTRGSWRAQITKLLDDARLRIAAEPAGLGSRLPRAFFAPGVLRLSQAGMTILEGAGLSPREAAGAWRALWSYTFGFATFTVGESPYPPLAAGAGELARAFADDGEFEEGLARLLDGLEARLGAGAR